MAHDAAEAFHGGTPEEDRNKKGEEMKQIVSLHGKLPMPEGVVDFVYSIEVEGRVKAGEFVMSPEEMRTVFVTPFSFLSGLSVPMTALFRSPSALTFARYLMNMWSRLIDGDGIHALAIRWTDPSNLIFELTTKNRADIELFSGGNETGQPGFEEVEGIPPAKVEEVQKNLKAMRRMVQDGINAVRVRMRGGVQVGGVILS